MNNNNDVYAVTYDFFWTIPDSNLRVRHILVDTQYAQEDFSDGAQFVYDSMNRLIGAIENVADTNEKMLALVCHEDIFLTPLELAQIAEYMVNLGTD